MTAASLARVKARRGRAIEVRAEPDMVDPDEIAHMRDRLRRGSGWVEQIARPNSRCR